MQSLNKRSHLIEVSLLFLKLGIIGFGGPAAHISMMENEVVKKRKWMSHEHFLDLVGATNLIPGPNSTEMTMHCGYERAGWLGLILAGVCFILPAAVITSIFAFIYQQYGAQPQLLPIIQAIKAAVIAIIISAIIPLAGKAFKSAELIILGIATAFACLWGLNEILALFLCGAFGLLLHVLKNPKNRANSVLFFLAVPPAFSSVAGYLKIFFIFLKVGALLYGSGYVLVAYLDAELVSRGLLSRTQLLDAISVGQFTPGPVLSTATFIGWQMHGAGGAIAATIGVFLPSFLFVALLNPLIPKLRSSKLMSSFLDAVNVAAVALIAVVCYQMGKEALSDWRTILIAVLSLTALLIFRKVNSAFVVIGAAAAGYFLYFF
jgi:chromate transporter